MSSSVEAPYFHITDDKHAFVRFDGKLICKVPDSISENDKPTEPTDESETTVDVGVFNVGEQITLTVIDWTSYPDGRIRLNLLFGEDNSVGANRYMGFAIRGDKDNGSRRYHYFKTAKYMGRGTGVIRDKWDKDSNPFQGQFKLIFKKPNATETVVEIQDASDAVFFTRSYTDSFPERFGDIKYISVFMTGSTRASYFLKKSLI